MDLHADHDLPIAGGALDQFMRGGSCGHGSRFPDKSHIWDGLGFAQPTAPVKRAYCPLCGPLRPRASA
ncbi:hypothetical protein CEE86_12510 [Lactobacillus crispatus]|nr:hypothetical protein CEE86_12510 [Lactobacillus crispatus]